MSKDQLWVEITRLSQIYRKPHQGNGYENSYVLKFAPLVASADRSRPRRYTGRASYKEQFRHFSIWTCDFILFANGGGICLPIPSYIDNILHTPDRYFCGVHFNKSFFRAILPAAIPLNSSAITGNLSVISSSKVLVR